MSLLLNLVLAGIMTAVPPTPAPPVFSSIIAHAPKATLHLEVADTERKREYGLMFRRVLLPHNGMVFVFEGQYPQNFWMKNTLVPLDVVFVDRHERVTSVAVNVPSSQLDTPDDRIARRSGLAMYVLELPAHEARDDGLVRGAKLSGLSNLKAVGF